MFKSRELARVSIDFNQLIHEVLTLVQGTLQRHAIVVHTELDEALIPVTGNRMQLQQVLFNLVTNAIEALESVADRMMLVKSERESSGEVQIAVEDSGNGINPENVDRSSAHFFTTKAEGMGMGLSICRSIIKSHGGRLWASPITPGGHSSIHFTGRYIRGRITEGLLALLLEPKPLTQINVRYWHKADIG